MDNNFKYLLGADIGGSHITAAVVDVKTRLLLRPTYIREHLDTNASAELIIKSWARVIKKSIKLSGKDVKHVGLALPGPFDYQAGISEIKNQGKYEKLYGLNVKEMLANALSISPQNLFFDNDAACFLKGEIFVGNAEANINILGITLGTGLGSVLAKNGNVTDAELWCSSYKEGIAEDYLSTRWFVKRYLELTGNVLKDVRQICEIGEKNATAQVFEEFGTNLNEFLNQKINLHSPELIVIGGNIVKAFSYFLSSLKALPIPVKIATLGEDSALMGAASGFLNISEI